MLLTPTHKKKIIDRFLGIAVSEVSNEIMKLNSLDEFLPALNNYAARQGLERFDSGNLEDVDVDWVPVTLKEVLSMLK